MRVGSYVALQLAAHGRLRPGSQRGLKAPATAPRVRRRRGWPRRGGRSQRTSIWQGLEGSTTTVVSLNLLADRMNAKLDFALQSPLLHESLYLEDQKSRVENVQHQRALA